MLTGRAAELRPGVNYLQRKVIVLVRPEDAQQPWAAPGEYAGLLRAWSRATNVKRARAAAARNAGRDIPTAGAARRRAKAHRNAGLCLQHGANGLCRLVAVDGTGRCEQHAPSGDA